jgi:hypothetical protein
MGRARERAKPTEEQLLQRRKHVHAEGHLDLVDLELQPFAEAFEEGHCGGLFLFSGLHVVEGEVLKQNLESLQISALRKNKSSRDVRYEMSNAEKVASEVATSKCRLNLRLSSSIQGSGRTGEPIASSNWPISLPCATIQPPL